MKKFIVTFLLIISVPSLANAQFTKIGGGLTYGTGFHFNNVTTPPYDAELHRGPFAGIFLTGIYELTLPIHISPSFTYFLPRTNKSTIATFAENTRVSAMMFDINGHYVFNSLDRFEFYGLAGLNIAFAKIKWLGVNPSSGSDNAMGLNVGAGTYMKITEQFDLYGEVKYLVSKYDQFMVNVGVLINLDWLKKNENPGI
jgi:opacity protein-like surface antigen